jgi:2-oxoisovalerate dehydrogenase E1 component
MSDNMTAALEKIDWKKVADLLMLSRAIDDIEETKLVPEKKVLYQFSAKGHELAQILLGMNLTDPNDAASAYYRSRPLMLTLGLTPVDAIASGMAKSGGYSDGRDIGVVCNLPGNNSPKVLPMAGDVGSQYTPAAGYAQAIQYRSQYLGDKNYSRAISVIMGGDGSVATNGFWSALTMATTLNLPVLFFIEDNGYGLSVKSDLQTPGGNIANNLYSFKNLRIIDGDGTEPIEASGLIEQAVGFVRDRKGPVLLRLTMPRLTGHSYQDNQAYKDEKFLNEEKKRDPIKKLKKFAVPDYLSEDEWNELQEKNQKIASQAAEDGWNRPGPDSSALLGTFSDSYDQIQKVGGLVAEQVQLPKTAHHQEPEKQRINIVEAIRRTLETELEQNDRLLVFGEDVGRKGVFILQQWAFRQHLESTAFLIPAFLKKESSAGLWALHTVD